jgi:DNA-directed RNA polymerase specialized sigma24 family protein
MPTRSSSNSPDREPLEALEVLAGKRRELARQERDALTRARKGGATLEQIGTALGVSRQAVHARLRRMNHGKHVFLPVVAFDFLGASSPFS